MENFTMSHRRTWIFVVLGVAALAGGGWLLTSPVWVNIEMGPMTGDPHYLLLNPFRDRGPEISAGKYLNAIQSPNCRAVVSSLPLSGEGDTKESICEKQERNPISPRCDLMERVDKDHYVYLEYWCPYLESGSTGIEKVWPSMEHTKDGWILKWYRRAQ
jgi:hypothetical protein